MLYRRQDMTILQTFQLYIVKRQTNHILENLRLKLKFCPNEKKNN